VISPLPPLVVASCNGSAHKLDNTSWENAFESETLLDGTPWSKQRPVVFSASCVSGGHALYAAKQLLSAGRADEVLVLAVDILSRANHDNFSGLRILAENAVTPWQPTSKGFLLGEAAVALRLVRVPEDSGHIFLNGPVLAGDLPETDALLRVISDLSPRETELVIGQGTGPLQNDEAELAAVGAFVEKNVPISSPLVHFGHTLGASTLLSIALAVLTQKTNGEIDCLSIPGTRAVDGRPLLNKTQRASEVLVTCRALSGACTATMVGTGLQTSRSQRVIWQTPASSGPLTFQILRDLAADACANRPAEPPDVLLIRLEHPLVPPERVVIGGRFLPSAALELTPGFIPQLVARCWGYDGPAICIVGDEDSDDCGFRKACEQTGHSVFQISLRGTGEKRGIEWNV
jgi:hypothetical protein